MRRTIRTLLLVCCMLPSALADPPRGSSIVWSGAQDIWIPYSGVTDVSVDLNSDGSPDLNVYYTIYEGEVIVARTVNGAQAIWWTVTGDTLPLGSGDWIGSALPPDQYWDGGRDDLVEYNDPVSHPSTYSGAGPWAGVDRGYMGVAFETGGDTYYGWVCMSVNDEYPEAYIHDWAWNTVPGAPILAGDTGFHYVSPTGSHTLPYSSWATAATNIQAAVDAANDGHVVIITNGTYPVRSAIVLTNGVTVASVNGRNTVTIDGQQLTRVVHMEHPHAVLRGITIANGWSGQFGGGIYCNRGRVEDCVVRNSEAYAAGGILCGADGLIVGSLIVSNNATGLDWDPGSAGGILCHGGRIERCAIQDNTAFNGIAGGVGLTSSGILADCTLTGNRARYAGGVACIMVGQVDRCRITGNVADDLAGGLWLWEGEASSSIIVDNTATTGAGAFLGPIEILGSGDPGMLAATSRLINCTVAANTAQSSVGGVICASNAVVQNSIIWDNAAPLFANVATGTPETVFLYTCTTPLLPGTGNITNAPQLTPSYRLRSTSPCIDAGTESDAPLTDIDGEARWDHPGHSNVVSIVDIGADEFVDTDLDHMADCWEAVAFGSVTNRDGTADADEDALNDVDEYKHSTTPTNPDTDADEMPDGWEVSHGLNPLADDAQGDPDCDNMRNFGEYVSDTDPHDADSVLSFIRVDRQIGGIRLDWKGGREAYQILECRENIASTTEQWTALFALPPPTAITNAVIDMVATNSVLFYRIRAGR